MQDHAVRTIRALLMIPLFLLAFHDLNPGNTEEAAVAWGWQTSIKV